MTFPFVMDDAGRAQSKRPKAKNDCTVRAIALAFCLGYDDSYDLLARAGRKSGQGFEFSDWINRGEVINKRRALKRSHPAVRGETRMNPVKFCDEYSRGIYICKTAKHVFAVINGVVHDDYQTYDERCIYTSWKIISV